MGKNLNRWIFFNPVEILSGSGVRQELPAILAKYQNVLVVCTKNGKSRLFNDPVLKEWANSKKLNWLSQVEENPDIRQLNETISSLRHLPKFDAIVGVGGGSVLDTAKVINVSLSETFLGVKIEDLISKSPSTQVGSTGTLILLPTTSGTGSEVTSFATVWDHAEKRKHSVFNKALYPKIAIVDPDLTYGLPRDITASTGLDAINQAIESIWNRNANSMTMGYATHSLKKGISALTNLLTTQDTEVDRVNLSEASLFAGLAISQTRTAICHSISYPLTAEFNIRHGIACAFTLPAVIEYCLEHDSSQRIEKLAKELIGNDAIGKDLLDLFKTLNEIAEVETQVKSKVKDFHNMERLVPKMITPGRSDNFVLDIDHQKILSILHSAWKP